MTRLKIPPRHPRRTPINKGSMSGQELWIKLQKLGFSQMGFARTIKVSDRTVRSWIGETYPVPKLVELFVNLMLDSKTNAEDLQG